jgi:hypothetical protein
MLGLVSVLVVMWGYKFCIVSISKAALLVTVTERSKACTIFSRSEAGIVGSNPTQGMADWCVYLFILCLCCPVCR